MAKKKTDEKERAELVEETEGSIEATISGEPLPETDVSKMDTTELDAPESETPEQDIGQFDAELLRDLLPESELLENSTDGVLSRADTPSDYVLDDAPDTDEVLVSQDISQNQEPSQPAESKPDFLGADTTVTDVNAPPAEPAEEKSNSTALARQAPRAMQPPSRRRSSEQQILTIESRAEIMTPDQREYAIWHEIQNARRTRRILTGYLGGIEQTESGLTLAIIYYNDLRVVIPLSEMYITVAGMDEMTKSEALLVQNKLLANMLGAEIDFIVRGIDASSRSVVGSRREAMLKKRQLFYFGTDASGKQRLYEGRIVQARVIAVAEKGVRVEIFGAECTIMARDLSWDWIGDAHERYSVGDEILVRIMNIERESLESVFVRADVKSVAGESGSENLKKCRVQGKYAGVVTDVHKGVVFIRLSIGANAIAHSCYDYRMPGKKDAVSFAVTHIDEERNVAVGIITRIIKQNL